MKRILREPKFNTDFVPNTEPDTKPKSKQGTIQETVDSQSLLDALDIYMIGVTLLARLARKPKYIIFAVTMADIKKALVLKKYINFATKVPVEY